MVSTISGLGYPGFSGDGGPALKAQLSNPIGICFDPAGNLYIADFSNQCIRRVDALTGNISTVAGSGVNNFSGDGGPAINARLNHPIRVCADKNDHLFILDYENRRVRMVNLVTGIITTVAGNGTNNYVDGGLAVNGGLVPLGIAVDQAGHLFISQPEVDPATSTTLLISKVDLSTGIITTLYGRGQPGAITSFFGSPPGLTCDGAGNLYAAGGFGGGVVRIDVVTGLVTGSYSNIGYAIDVALDGQGHLIVSDMTGAQVKSVDLQTGVSTLIAGDGVAGMGPDCVSPTASRMDYPMGVAVGADDNVYYSEFNNQRVRKIYVSSGAMQMTVSASVSPSCAGVPVTFTAQVTNAGSGGTYQWKLNGADVGNNAATFTSSALQNSDQVSCAFALPGTGACDMASDGMSVQIFPVLSPAIDISTPLSTLCGDHSATFTAAGKDAGNNPVYQWLLNGSPVGGNTDSYAATDLADNDVVECRLTVDPTASCANVPNVTSSPIRIRIIEAPAPSIQVSASVNPICPGDPVVLTAAALNAGTDFAYQWQLNGEKVGDNSNTYTNAHLQDGDLVSCALIIGHTACSTGLPVVADPTLIAVRKVPAITLPFTDTTILPGRQIILQAAIQGNFQSWQWSPADELSNPSALAPLTVPMTTMTNFRLTAFSVDGCQVHKDILVRLFYKLALPNSFTPNGDGRNDVFRIPPFVTLQLGEFSVYDKWGNKIFSTKNIGTGWDGTWKGKACAAGTYVYVITGKTIQGEVLSKGTVTLLR